MVHKAKHKVRFIELNFKIIMRTLVVELNWGIDNNDLHVLRWLRYQSTELQTYYKLKRKNRTFKYVLNQQLAQTCC